MRKAKKGLPSGRIEKFYPRGGGDCYNPSAPFFYNGALHIAARVEPRENEFASEIAFFKKSGAHAWHEADLPRVKLQDPFLFRYEGDYVLGGVRVKLDTRGKLLSYKTVFYRGKDLKHLTEWMDGPDRMKCLRFMKLKDGRNLVFTRPQTSSEIDPLGRGRVGFLFTPSLNSMKRLAPKARLLDGWCKRDEWVGGNQLFELENGNVGVIGHRARYDKRNNRHYEITAAEFDLKRQKAILMKRIARRSAFPQTEAKRPDIYDVLYPGGIVKNKNGSYKLFVGIGDAAVGSMSIKNPFSAKPVLT